MTIQSNRCSDASCKTSVMSEPEGKSEDQKSYSGSSSVDHECLQKICMPIHPMFPPTQPGRLLPGPNVDHECRLCDNVLEFYFLTTTSVVLFLRPVRRHCHHWPLKMSNIRVPVDVLHLTFWPLSSCLQVSGSTAGSLASSSSPSTSSRQYTRQRITRVNLRDLIFYMEQERETAHSLLLYRALLK